MAIKENILTGCKNCIFGLFLPPFFFKTNFSRFFSIQELSVVDFFDKLVRNKYLCLSNALLVD